MYVDAAEWKSTYMGGRCRSQTVGGTTDGMELAGGGTAGCREGGQNGSILRHEGAELGRRQSGRY